MTLAWSTKQVIGGAGFSTVTTTRERGAVTPGWRLSGVRAVVGVTGVPTDRAGARGAELAPVEQEACRTVAARDRDRDRAGHDLAARRVDDPHARARLRRRARVRRRRAGRRLGDHSHVVPVDAQQRVRDIVAVVALGQHVQRVDGALQDVRPVRHVRQVDRLARIGLVVLVAPPDRPPQRRRRVRAVALRDRGLSRRAGDPAKPIVAGDAVVVLRAGGDRRAGGRRPGPADPA